MQKVPVNPDEGHGFRLLFAHLLVVYLANADDVKCFDR